MGKNKHLDLFKEIIPAIDMGFRELWDAADEGGKKDIKGDLWNLNRYISSVSGSFEKQALAVFKTNEYYNKNWAVIGSDHPKLQWLLLCQAGSTGEKEFHPWIKLNRKSDLSDPSVKLISEIYPNMKMDEVNLLVKISTKEELRALAREHGIENFKPK